MPEPYIPQRRVEFKDIYDKDPFLFPYAFGSTSDVASSYNVFFNAHFPCEVVEYSAVWSAASVSGTLNLEKLTGTEALDGGVNLLSSNISTSGVANTMNFSTLVVGSPRQLARGDRLANKDGGTLTGLAGLSIGVLIKPLGKGHYQSHGASLN